jgi:2-haloacid dehalogenase
MTVKAVIFDIGNVLLEWDPRGFYDRVYGRARREALFAEVALDAMNLEVDRGAPFRASVYALAEKHPEYTAEIRDWHDRWIEMASPEIPRSVALLRALRRKGIPVHALSNFGIDTFELAAAHYDFLAEFDRRFISGHLRLIKPDAAIYATVEADLGFPPETLLFADDRPENIAAARARGWQVHLFEGADGWARRLVDEGLLTEAETAA